MEVEELYGGGGAVWRWRSMFHRFVVFTVKSKVKGKIVIGILVMSVGIQNPPNATKFSYILEKSFESEA